MSSLLTENRAHSNSLAVKAPISPQRGEQKIGDGAAYLASTSASLNLHLQSPPRRSDDGTRLFAEELKAFRR